MSVDEALRISLARGLLTVAVFLEFRHDAHADVRGERLSRINHHPDIADPGERNLGRSRFLAEVRDPGAIVFLISFVEVAEHGLTAIFRFDNLDARNERAVAHRVVSRERIHPAGLRNQPLAELDLHPVPPRRDFEPAGFVFQNPARRLALAEDERRHKDCLSVPQDDETVIAGPAPIPVPVPALDFGITPKRLPAGAVVAVLPAEALDLHEQVTRWSRGLAQNIEGFRSFSDLQRAEEWDFA